MVLSLVVAVAQGLAAPLVAQAELSRMAAAAHIAVAAASVVAEPVAGLLAVAAADTWTDAEPDSNAD